MDFIYMNTFLCIFLLMILFKILLTFIDKSKKNLPPGPPALPILGHLHLVKLPFHQWLKKISDRYGPAVFLRLGSRPVLVVSNQTLADQCFTTHDLTFANRVHLPTVQMQPNLIVWANYGPYWRTVRQAAATELLSSQQLHASSQIRATLYRNLSGKLFSAHKSQQSKSEESSSFKKLAFKKMLFDLMLDMMLITIAGKNNDDSDEMKEFSEALATWFELTGAANVEDYIPLLRILDLKGTMRRMKHLTAVNDRMVQKMIDEHRQEGVGKRNTMINSLLQLQKKDSEKYSDVVVRGMVISLILGGTETTATTIEWAMAELLNNPEILNKAVAEIDAHLQNERLIQESDMNNLPYLTHIISETLRLHPTVPLLAPHESREEIKLGGYDIPKGTMLLVNTYPIQRDPSIWYEPNKFIPERFEDGNSDGKFMIPFGMGRRRCPGETFAMRMMGALLGTLVQCFEWKRVGSELIDLTEGVGLSTPLGTPLEAMYRPRDAMKNVLSEL